METSMSLTSKTTSLQSYNMLVYRNAIHPEFFQIEGRHRIEHGEYEFESWIFKGGHVVRFEHNGLCVTEVITDRLEPLPDRGLITALPCAGEKDHEAEFGDRITYITSMQTETLTDHLYLGTFNELSDHARDSECPCTIYDDEDGRTNLSLIDVQRFSDQVHLQGYHMRSDCGLVLRTQSIFQVSELQ